MNEFAKNWLYDEFQQTGKDYASLEEVEIYDPSHDDFRDIAQEIREVENWIQPDKTSVLLDIGCGTGNFALHFAKYCHHVYALDISLPMLSLAEKKAKKEQVNHIEFIHSGYLHFELPENHVHGVISSLSLHHLPDYWKSKALEKIYQVLKPDGRFYLYDVIIPDHQPETSIHDFIDRQGKRGGDFLREDTIIHFKEEYSTFDWIMKGLLENAGFKILKERTYDGVLKKYFCAKPSTRS
ncbi:MAG: methyltransferase domain-containing protein [Cyclobacteriaceae bacterium]